jgi:uncharacterized protein
LVFANWGQAEEAGGFWYVMFTIKWWTTSVAAIALGVILAQWYHVAWWKVGLAFCLVLSSAILIGRENPGIPFTIGFLSLTAITVFDDEGESGNWFSASWDFAKMILPLLLLGILASGFFLGRPGHEGVIPSVWISIAVGGNSLLSNFVASFVGAFMYFATLTEIPILQGLLGSGMGKGPALALLLAGPALSLPSMLVINKIMGFKKTAVYVCLVIVMSTITGMLFGAFV